MSDAAWRGFDLFAPTPEHALLADTLREFVRREVEVRREPPAESGYVSKVKASRLGARRLAICSPKSRSSCPITWSTAIETNS